MMSFFVGKVEIKKYFSSTLTQLHNKELFNPEKNMKELILEHDFLVKL